RHVQLLLAAGADPACQLQDRSYPVESAMQLRDYRLVVMLLEAGASPHYPRPDSNRRRQSYDPRLTHLVLRHEEQLPFSNPQQGADYDALIKWLKDHGADFAAARADLDKTGRP
ncbi:unnamed protein product, partial [Ectocarpus sp. 4 AP-2014]